MDARGHHVTRIAQAFRREEAAALKVSVYGRCLVLGLIAPWLWFVGAFDGDPNLPYILVAFGLSGLLQLWIYLRNAAQPWAKFAFVFFDFALLTVAILGTTPEAYAPCRLI